ncbi:FMN-binding protein [Kitasatospora sp. NBC_01266]|uniref:FMN-binding protein n=1 Tax=Kitasatospora sp. NBC_01266 TaxID=2903572 RepID=UPI002E33EEF5|nr:FMN-binding protein [Kitasatospora sp. NBC_01266]
MRKITMALLSTSAGVALLLGAKAASAGAPRSALADNAGARHRGSQTGPAPAAAAPSPPATGTGGSGGSGGSGQAGSGQFTGSAVDTPYGTVQVQAVLSGGKLTDVTVLQQTDGRHSSQIDSYALPVLRSEALAAQNANIDVVSGATYTSDGYAQSLQAALDAAGR